MKHNRLLITHVVLVVSVLASALVTLSGCGAGVSLGSTNISLVKAAELPVSDPDIVGIFERREDQSLYVGSHMVNFSISKECEDCPARKMITYNGPIVEVVVTRNTLIYRDATSLGDPVVDGKVQQVLAPGSLDDVGPEALVQAWGDRQGDRLVARVLVYNYLPE